MTDLRSKTRLRSRPAEKGKRAVLTVRREAMAYGLSGFELSVDPPESSRAGFQPGKGHGATPYSALRTTLAGYGCRILVRGSSRPFVTWPRLLMALAAKYPHSVPIVVDARRAVGGEQVYTDQAAAMIPLGHLFNLIEKARRYDEHERRVNG